MIKAFKKEHADLIMKIESMKIEKEQVSSKIGKSENLMMGLGSEKSRWEIASKKFDD